MRVEEEEIGVERPELSVAMVRVTEREWKFSGFSHVQYVRSIFKKQEWLRNVASEWPLTEQVSSFLFI